MHHKRGRARNQRAGCKLCKPWKANGVRTERAEGEKHSDHVRRIALPADPNDPEDFDVTEEALQQALAEREERRRLRTRPFDAAAYLNVADAEDLLADALAVGDERYISAARDVLERVKAR